MVMNRASQIDLAEVSPLEVDELVEYWILTYVRLVYKFISERESNAI